MQDATIVTQYLKDKRNVVVSVDRVAGIIARLKATTHENASKTDLLKAVIAFFDNAETPESAPIDSREEEEESVTKMIHDYELSRKTIIARDPESVFLHAGDTARELTPYAYTSWRDSQVVLATSRTVVRVYIPRHVKSSCPFVYLSMSPTTTIPCEVTRVGDTWDVYAPIVPGEAAIVRPGTYKPDILDVDRATSVLKNHMPVRLSSVAKSRRNTTIHAVTVSGGRRIAVSVSNGQCTPQGTDEVVFLPDMGFVIFMI